MVFAGYTRLLRAPTVTSAHYGSHISKGALSNAQADEAVAALQANVSAMVARNGPPSPTGKRKFGVGRGKGGGGVEAGPPAMPQV